jgi:flagellar M-ring protein FliF
MIVRPLIKALTSRTLLIDDEGNQVDSSGNLVESTSGNASAEIEAEVERQPLLASNGDDPSELNSLLATTAESSYENKLEFARLMIQDDPKRVANVIKEWVASNG